MSSMSPTTSVVPSSASSSTLMTSPTHQNKPDGDQQNETQNLGSFLFFLDEQNLRVIDFTNKDALGEVGLHSRRSCNRK